MVNRRSAATSSSVATPSSARRSLLHPSLQDDLTTATATAMVKVEKTATATVKVEKAATAVDGNYGGG